MRVLVTGGTGYLGAAIVRALHARQHVPVVFARRASTSGLPGELIDGDVRDAGTVDRAVRGVDAVIHAAALVSIWHRRSSDFADVNIGGLRHVLEAADAAGITRLVYTSSFMALPPRGASQPLQANDYQRTKTTALGVARAAAAARPVTILFPGVVYGPGLFTEGNLVGRLIHDHLKGRLPGLIGADRLWSYAYVEDVAAAHVAALDHQSGEFVLGGENAPQMRVFDIVHELRGVSRPRRIPYTLAHIAGAIEEARARITGKPPLLTRGAVEIFRCDWSLDSGRSMSELNYRITPLSEGIRRTLASIS